MNRLEILIVLHNPHIIFRDCTQKFLERAHLPNPTKERRTRSPLPTILTKPQVKQIQDEAMSTHTKKKIASHILAKPQSAARTAEINLDLNARTFMETINKLAGKPWPYRGEAGVELLPHGGVERAAAPASGRRARRVAVGSASGGASDRRRREARYIK
jgi:hypothetical protein